MAEERILADDFSSDTSTIAQSVPNNDDTITPPVPVRRDTISSEGGSERTDTCRICRSEGTAEEPLFYPCKCSGSIKFVHQECLMEWLSHSHKKHCELCKTPFRFTKLYDANMPQTLPWNVFVGRACWHIMMGLVRGARTGLVAFVWLILIPFAIRWVWRWLFWIADAAWAREAFKQVMLAKEHAVVEQTSNAGGVGNVFQQYLFGMSSNFTNRFFGTGTAASAVVDSTTSVPAPSFAWPRAEPSLLSGWPYLANLTSRESLNRVLLDVFEGQLITCVVITGFILVFLIREWVVQQQPLANLDNVQQQLREATERVQADNERLRRQQELLEQARARLVELQNETEDLLTDAAELAEQDSTGNEKYIGWEALEALIDLATGHLRLSGETEHARFLHHATTAVSQIRVAGRQDKNTDEVSEKVYRKLASYSHEERQEWEAVLVSQLHAIKIVRDDDTVATAPDEQDQTTDAASEPIASEVRSSRPHMPGRNASSRAAQIQRMLTEAEEVFSATREGSNASRSEDVQASNATPTVISGPTTDDPQEVAVSSEPPSTNSTPSLAWKNVPMPITNAGPDAKINIKWSGTSKAPDGFRIVEKMLEVDEKLSKLKDEVEEETTTQLPTPPPTRDGLSHRSDQITDASRDNPFHPDGPEPEPWDEAFRDEVAQAFSDQHGQDEAQATHHSEQAESNVGSEPSVDDTSPSNATHREPARPSRLERLADWFWGDIQPRELQEPAAAVNEERQDIVNENENQVAAFVPVEAARPDDSNADPADAGTEQPQNDPEVVAAAQQAGIQPEVVEEAEDLEGLFELIGLQGPLLGLFQTSAFCLLLVACSILCTVILPYFIGKAILSLVHDPVYFLLQLPLRMASSFVDFVLDTTILVTSSLVITASFATDYALSVVKVWKPSFANVQLPGKVTEYCTIAMANAANRLQTLMPAGDPTADSTTLGWAFLRWSAHSHASLIQIENEVGAVFHAIGAAITWVVETVSSSSVLAACRNAFLQLRTSPSVSVLASEAMARLDGSVKPFITGLRSLAQGTLTFSTSETSLDPSLVYWNSADHAFAIAAGYMAFAALAAIYVAADIPISTSESSQKTEKLIRDTLRQAGGVLKVILIISIEMLVFPLYCGLLLDVAFLPLFKETNVASRWAFALRKPSLFCFVHWFVGTCYMFHFALFVGMCRKILRKGTLWFIRDPDDPSFHPVRDVLERNVATQLRKIAFSALVYGALVILCLGGVIWAVGRVFKEIFPIHWVTTEPFIEFPFDMLIYNFVAPLIIRLAKPSDTVKAMYTWWLRRCARGLRLSHFLFDDRRKDEEGHVMHRSWKSLMQTPDPANPEDPALTSENQHVNFVKDGTYVLTPCNDSYRPPKSDEAFLHLDENDARIVDKDGKKNGHFAKIYLPPLFRLRISLFLVCLWIFSAFVGLCSTVLPLLLGRYLLSTFLPEDVKLSDIYAYSLGAYLVGGVVYSAMKWKTATSYFHDKIAVVNLKAWVEPTKRFGVSALKCVYVYGFLGLIVPMIFAFVLQFYIVLPLHTWSASVAQAAANAQKDALTTTITKTVTKTVTESTHAISLSNDVPLNSTQQAEGAMGTVVEHTFHVLQDYTIGLLYVRIFSRMVLGAPASRAAEAFRRITANGYLDPDVKLATRFFVLPTSLIAAILLAGPPLLAKLAMFVVQRVMVQDVLADEVRTKLYRYSYPIAASIIVAVLGALELSKATARWRTRIRDEAYLVGERLHNFGERRPPPGSKSVVRKEK